MKCRLFSKTSWDSPWWRYCALQVSSLPYSLWPMEQYFQRWQAFYFLCMALWERLTLQKVFKFCPVSSRMALTADRETKKKKDDCHWPKFHVKTSSKNPTMIKEAVCWIEHYCFLLMWPMCVSRVAWRTEWKTRCDWFLESSAVQSNQHWMISRTCSSNI